MWQRRLDALSLLISMAPLSFFAAEH